MNVLEQNHQVFLLLWVFPTPASKGKWIKFRNILFSLANLFAVFGALVFSIGFAFRYAASDLENTLYSLFQIVAYGLETYLLVVGYKLGSEIAELFSKLQQICDTYDTFKFMEQANQRAENWTKFLTKYIIMIWIPCGLSLNVSSLIICIIRFHLIDVDVLYVPYKFVLPWNQHTISGWIYESAFSSTAACAYFLINNSFLSFFIGICFYHHAFTQHIKALLQNIEVDRHSRFETKSQLSEIIRFHNAAKDFFLQSADVYSVLILFHLICSMIFLACSIFQLDLAFKHFGVGFFLILMAIGGSASNLFLFSYYGHSANLKYSNIAGIYFESKWLNLPQNLQKYFIIMIANAQRPLYYHGFGVAYLDLNTFLRMLKTVASFYMMFKTLTDGK